MNLIVFDVKTTLSIIQFGVFLHSGLDTDLQAVGTELACRWPLLSPSRDWMHACTLCSCTAGERHPEQVLPSECIH